MCARSLPRWSRPSFLFRPRPAVRRGPVVAVWLALLLPLSASPGGVVVRWGDVAWTPLTFAHLTNVVAVAGGHYYEAVLTSDGEVYVAGAPVEMGLSHGGPLTNMVAIASGAGFLLCLDAQGRVHGFGATEVPEPLTDVIGIAAGLGHGLAVQSDGTVVAWGRNEDGQTNVPAGLQGAIAVAGGAHHSLALLENGTVVGWPSDNGLNNTYYGAGTPPPGLDEVTAIAAGLFHSVARRSDGSVVAWGEPNSAAVPSEAGSGIDSVASSGYHTVALRSDGTVLSWGGTLPGVNEPPPELSGATSVHASLQGAYAVSRGPSILHSPEGGNIAAGDDFVLHVDAVGIGTLAYQWRKDGEDLPAASASTLELANVQASAAGAYAVQVWNELGRIASHPVELQVIPVPPSLVQWAGSRAATSGSTVSFTVTARGSEPFEYQWYHNGISLAGAVGSELILAAVTLAEEGAYTVRVRNELGSVESPPAFLTLSLPLVFAGPRFQVVRAGMQTRLTAEIHSPGPFDLQWQLGGMDLDGATEPELFLSEVRPHQAGSYRVRVRNDFGTVESDALELHVRRGPDRPGLPVAWGNYPDWMDRLDGLTDVLDLAVGGWHLALLRADGRVTILHPPTIIFDGQVDVPPGLDQAIELAGGPNHTLALRQDGTVVGWGSRVRENFGQWRVPAGLGPAAAIAAGDMHSLALLTDGTVRQWPASSEPSTQTLISNLNQVVSIAAGIDHNVALRSDGTVVAWAAQYPEAEGAGNVPELTHAVAIAAGGFHSLALTADGRIHGWGNNTYGQASPPEDAGDVVAIAAGRFQSYAMRSDGSLLGWGYSPAPPLELTGVTRFVSGPFQHAAVTLAPLFMDEPGDAGALVGGTVEFRALVRSATPCSYQWWFEEEPIPGATGMDLKLSGVQPAHNGAYRLLASNEDWTVASRSAQLTIYGPPHVLPGTNVTLHAGESFALVHRVAGPGPMAYQHYFQGEALAGATQEQLELSNLQDHHAGSYSLAVSNPYGTTHGPPVELTVLPAAPQALVEATTLRLREGDVLELTTGAWGSEPMEYTWLRNGFPLNDEVGNVLRIASLTATDAGSYTVRIGNALGEITLLVAEIELEPSAPVLLDLPRVMMGFSGDALAIEPRVAGTRPIQAHWFRDGHPLVDWDRLDLAFASLGDEDSGLYSLRVENQLGSVQAGDVRLIVRSSEPPMRLVVWGHIQAPPGLDGLIAIAGGQRHALGLRADGTVVAWGAGPGTLVPVGVDGVVAVAAGDDFSLALHRNGRVTGWGENMSGQASPPADLDDALAIGAGVSHGLAVRVNGQVVAWGSGVGAATPPPASLTNAVGVAAGQAHNVALTEDGQVVAWGGNFYNQTRVPVGLSDAVSVHAGNNHSLAITRDGRWFGWGDGRAGQYSFPFGVTNVLIGTAGGDTSLLLLADDTFLSAGDFRSGQRVVPSNLVDVRALVLGGRFGAALSPTPRIWRTPEPARPMAGMPLVLSAQAAGASPLGYQWYKDGQPIHGASDPVWLVPEATAANSGFYFVQVSNDFGTDTSSPVRVIVVYPAMETPLMRLPTIEPAGGLRFEFSAEPGAYYRVLISEDLIDWVEWIEAVATTDHVSFVEDFASPGASRFYRVVSP